MTAWPQARLETVCELVTDGTHYTPPEQAEGLPFLTVKDMGVDGLDFNGCARISEAEFDRAERGGCVPRTGDVLFSKDGTVGKVHVVRDGGRYALLSSIAIIRPTPTVLDSSYLARVLSSPEVRQQAAQMKTGSALRRVILKDLKRVTIPLPPLLEQRRIAAILDKADAVRRKRQQTLDLADQFLRSVFLDMFGDPATNPKGWPVRKLSDAFVTDRPPTKCGPFGSALRKEEYAEAGVPVLTMNNILGDSFSLEGCLFVPQGKWEALAQYEVRPGDIIISRAGTVGKMCVVPDLGVPAVISTNLIRLSLDPDVVEPTYFVTLANYCRGRVGTLRTGADGSYSFMNTGILEKLRLPIPPVLAQRRWGQLRSAADQCAALMDHDVRELAALAATLVRCAFLGELTGHGPGVRDPIQS